MDDAVSKKAAEQTNGPSRREFLTRTGLLAGGMALMGMPGFRPPLPAAAAVDTRTFTGGTSALELDGQFVDSLKSAEGGFPKADVIQEPAGPSPFVKKHIGQPKYQDITIQCDPVMPKPLFDWIASTLTMSHMRKSGAIITADYNRVMQSRLQFTNAVITEIGFPACDGAAKDRAYLTVKFAPELTVPLAGKGSLPGTVGTKAKAWLPSNFRLTIPGLDCSKVMKIEALTVKQTVATDNIGDARNYQKEPGKLEFPNLVITLAENAAGTFYAWFQDMVLKGNAGENNEKSGTLELLDSTLREPLLTISFLHLGIFGFSPEKAAANTDAIRRVKVEMYCEQMTLAPGKA